MKLSLTKELQTTSYVKPTTAIAISISDLLLISRLWLLLIIVL